MYIHLEVLVESFYFNFFIALFAVAVVNVVVAFNEIFELKYRNKTDINKARTFYNWNYLFTRCEVEVC